MDCFVLEKKVLENVNLFCLAPPFLASSLFIFLFCFVCFFVFLFVLFASQERKISRGNLHFFRHILLLCFYFIFGGLSSLLGAVVAPRGKPAIRDNLWCRFWEWLCHYGDT